jgi:hypothetical protein
MLLFALWDGGEYLQGRNATAQKLGSSHLPRLEEKG